MLALDVYPVVTLADARQRNGDAHKGAEKNRNLDIYKMADGLVWLFTG